MTRLWKSNFLKLNYFYIYFNFYFYFFLFIFIFFFIFKKKQFVLNKIKIENQTVFEDSRSLVALNSDYCTTEGFFPKEYDLRIQKIGEHYRAYKRQSNNWKTNVGSSILTEIEMNETFKFW